ncbi:hypothetical protein JX265_005686 [Neoarthrinium moseri]|uniref:Apple domain-containing protein n=1 Tax=Neoarthrinium moseri TaxID=1658444 RepID=A0A9P9WN47_9PEZI|nr:hypothetical protein JX266_005546 [Neoarthrinium moseri]KAI1871700.1 hypothetical protein JX265_005686 [Neoarthrinium moseri]
MVGFSLGKSTLCLMLGASMVVAVDPSPADKKFWDDKCKAKHGQLYSMVFDSNGKPTTTCRAPPFKGCYWGPYTNPKTNQPGCCEKGNGEFSTDPIATLEGGCCVKPQKYSFDVGANQGGCCPQGQHLSWDTSVQPLLRDGKCCDPGFDTSVDKATKQSYCCPQGLSYVSDPATLKGDCCEPGKIFSIDAGTGKGECCDNGQVYSIDPSTGKGSCCAANAEFKCDCKCTPKPPVDYNPECPKNHLQIIENGGKKWKIFCELINHGANDISITPNVPNHGQCINNCAKDSKCVRAIYNANIKTCYLRTHGNKEDAKTPGGYASAHLIEDSNNANTAAPPQSSPPATAPPATSPPASNPPPSSPPTTNVPSTDAPSTAPPQSSGSPGDIGDPKHCPDVGNRHVDVGGVMYEIQCTKGVSENFPDYRVASAADIGECAALCTADPKCQGVNFYDDGGSDGCLMMSEHEYPATGTPRPGDNLISAVPIKKR